MSAPPTNAGRRFVPEPLTRDEVKRLLSAASNRSSSGIRLRGMVGVMYGAGLRLAEALTLYPRDVDTRDGTVRVRTGKGEQYRTVGITTAGAAQLDRWLDHRRALGLTGQQPTFCTYELGRAGLPLSQRYVRTALRRLGDRAGIEKRVHPHGLRHSMAFAMAQDGVPMHQIQAQLGHKSLAVTDVYVRHLLPADVVQVMRQREW